MPALNFTKTAIEALPTPVRGRSAYQDSKVPGLLLRVSTSGVKSFSWQRWISGAYQHVHIGTFPDVTPEVARRRAQELNAQKALGLSPKDEIRRKRTEGKTLAAVVEEYLAARPLKPGTVKDIRQGFSDTFSDWLPKPISNITKDDVLALHRKRSERSEARANTNFRYLRAVCSFAVAAGTLTENPVKVLTAARAWNRSVRKQTHITAAQLPAWFKTVGELPSRTRRDYLLTLLLTGLRANEARTLAWADVDLGKRTLTVRDTKNRRDHILPLGRRLHALLSARPVSVSVFEENGRMIKCARGARAKAAADSGVQFTLHDLRRTFATVAEGLDIPHYALKRLLNHSDGADVTAGYVVRDVGRLRAPMQLIEDALLAAGGEEGVKLFPPVQDSATELV